MTMKMKKMRATNPPRSVKEKPGGWAAKEPSASVMAPMRTMLTRNMIARKPSPNLFCGKIWWER